MNLSYHIENSNLSEKFESLFNFLNTKALDQPLHDVEHELFKYLLSMGKILLEGFIEQKGNGKDSAWIPENSGKLPYNSIKERKYLSIFGDIRIERAYFWKKGSKGYFPLDFELHLPLHHHSNLLDKWIQLQVTQGPYDEGIENICDLLDLKVSKKIVQEVNHEASQEVENFYYQKANFEDEGSHIIAQVDCKGVIMVTKERPESKLKEGFVRRAKGVSKIGIRKDAVVTVDFTINPVSRTPKELLEGLMLINSNQKKEAKNKEEVNKDPKIDKKIDREIKNKQIAATMYGKDKAYTDLGNRIKARDPDEKKPIFVLLDGAHALKKGFEKEFQARNWDSRITGYCLDIVHATEYLWDASTAMYGETSPKRISWVKSALLKILNSKVEKVIDELTEKMNATKSEFIAKRLKRSITYFENHKDMMDYKRYLNQGYPIASGAIEGACNTLVKDRTDRSGMKWTKKGAAAVINLRSVRCNKDWNEYWNYQLQKQSESLYGKWKNLAA